MYIYFHHDECTMHALNNCCKPQNQKQLHFHLEDLFSKLLISIRAMVELELSTLITFLIIFLLKEEVTIIMFRFLLTC